LLSKEQATSNAVQTEAKIYCIFKVISSFACINV